MPSGELKPLVFFVGPTATGKSSLGLQWAMEHQSIILNGDSLQVYREVNIGTAKPTQQERDRVPHRLFDFVLPPEEFTAGKYSQMARAEIKKEEDVSSYVLVGGSGFYIQAFEKGMYSSPEVAENIKVQISNYISAYGENELFVWLRQLDSEYSQKISSNDVYRVKRAIEMILSTGLSMSQIQQKFEQQKESLCLKNPICKVGLFGEKPWLKERVSFRVDQMLERGLVEEAETLLKRGLKDWWPMKSVGYLEVVSFLEGHIKSTEELKELIVRNTMYLAKRQRTWFKRDSQIQWFDASQPQNHLYDRVKEYIQKSINVSV